MDGVRHQEKEKVSGEEHAKAHPFSKVKQLQSTPTKQCLKRNPNEPTTPLNLSHDKENFLETRNAVKRPLTKSLSELCDGEPVENAKKTLEDSGKGAISHLIEKRILQDNSLLLNSGCKDDPMELKAEYEDEDEDLEECSVKIPTNIIQTAAVEILNRCKLRMSSSISNADETTALSKGQLELQRFYLRMQRDVEEYEKTKSVHM